MYKDVSKEWEENIYKNTQKVLNIYFDDILVNPDYITKFKPRKPTV